MAFNRNHLGLCLAALALVFAASSIKGQVGAQTAYTQTAYVEKGVVALDSNNFKSQVEESDLPVVVDAFAKWCGPCKRLAPVLESMSQEFEGKVRFAKLDVDQDRNLARDLNISSMPTLLFYKEGKLVGRHTGYLNESELRKKLESL